MGNCGQRASLDEDQKARAIDQQIRKDKKVMDSEVKLLLLGTLFDREILFIAVKLFFSKIGLIWKELASLEKAQSRNKFAFFI
jgi:hypothetical protein